MLVGVLVGYLVFKDTKEVVKYLPQPSTYTYQKCYDNDNNSFSQEYVDTKLEQEFSKAEEKYGKCVWKYGGNQSILGCTGDLFYMFECN